MAPYTFEDFIGRTSKARDFDELFSVLSKTVKQQGFDRIIFSVAQDNELPNQYNKIGLAQNYPADWQEHYTEKEYSRIDPVLRFAAIAEEPFTWKKLESQFTLSRKQTKFMREGEDAKLFNGVGIPIRLGVGQFAGVALATSEEKDACNINLDLLNAYCQQFYLAFRRLYKQENKFSEISVLSKKEEEILLWVSRGKTDEDIGVILGITKNTVDTHMRHIFEKLDATNRVVAVVKAITLGLIKP